MKRINARSPLASFGIWMLGPVLLEYANEEQKKKFLPDIVRRQDRAGARAIPSRARDPISPRCRRSARTRAITG
jgi:alkylation response protein AidB-like acyl-CoA dehydrogenase